MPERSGFSGPVAPLPDTPCIGHTEWLVPCYFPRRILQDSLGGLASAFTYRLARPMKGPRHNWQFLRFWNRCELSIIITSQIHVGSAVNLSISKTDDERRRPRADGHRPRIEMVSTALLSSPSQRFARGTEHGNCPSLRIGSCELRYSKEEGDVSLLTGLLLT